jgi:hypothetical protein
MDPASLVIGIASLSGQLKKMITTINELVAAYRSAAKELDDLCLKLDDIETICESLGMALSQAGSSTQIPGQSRLLNKLHRSIKDCYDKVSIVHQVIQRISAKIEKGHNPLKSMGFLFLQHRRQLASCVDGLDKSCSSLQFILASASL